MDNARRKVDGGKGTKGGVGLGQKYVKSSK